MSRCLVPNLTRNSLWLYVIAMLLAGQFTGTARAQTTLGFQRAVGGIAIDPTGVLRQCTVQEREALVKQAQEHAGKVAGELGPAVEMRKISLQGIQAALADALANNRPVPAEVLYLAGIQRIEYVLVNPAQKDIILAGPGEGWRVNAEGNVVGVTTGLPVLNLDDLVVALRSVKNARNEGISVSIDPTAEGLRKRQEFLTRQRQFTPEAVNALAEVMGPQTITFTGVPTDSHFASVLAAADYRMKRLALNLDESPIAGLPGYLDLLKAKRAIPRTDIPRWWMACSYEPLLRSEDRLVWQLRGPGVKAMTEAEVIAKDGTTQGTGKEDPSAKEWAKRFTEKYGELAQKVPVFAQLRDLMDLCVVAALIEKEDLCGLAGCDLALLRSPSSNLVLDKQPVAKEVSTICSFVRIGSKFVITSSGGVQIESWEVASRSEVSSEVKDKQSQAAAPAGKTWWWN